MMATFFARISARRTAPEQRRHPRQHARLVLDVTYVVAYEVALFYDTTKAAKSGSTLPLKLRITNAAGSNVSSAAIVPHAGEVRKLSDATSSDVADPGNANPNSNLRYDSSIGGTGGYIFT